MAQAAYLLATLVLPMAPGQYYLSGKDICAITRQAVMPCVVATSRVAFSNIRSKNHSRLSIAGVVPGAAPCRGVTWRVTDRYLAAGCCGSHRRSSK
jgi:hypothetical protein